MSSEQAPRGALYYPYIHIKNPNWLKANLLMFPFVERMVPMPQMDSDKEVIRQFTKDVNNKEPLLRPAPIWSGRAVHAQKVLAEKLKRDSKQWKFLEKYGREATTKQKDKDNPYGFQIHAEKLSKELKEVLHGSGLAWIPGSNEPYDRWSEYVEVHPNIGQAVMATLAIACAETDGLDIVGDERSGALHRCLMEKKLDDVYEAWLSLEEKHMTPPAPATGEELMEFILGLPSEKSSLEQLTPERLYALTEERGQINKLMVELRRRAAAIRAVDDFQVMEEAYKDAANDIMKNWQSDRNNFANFGRTFFGQDSTKLATNFASSVADKTLTGIASGKITKAAIAATGGWLGTLAAGGVIGAGAGLLIGLLMHTGTTYKKQRQREENSPYRFLTTLEKAGILFHTELMA